MTNCQVCGSELKLVPAGVSKKTGKAYNSFMACPNKCKTSFNDTRPPYPPQPQPPAPVSLKDQFIVEEIQGLRKEFNERMDALAKYLSSKLG